MAKVLAITGGIGSGKSYIVKMFAALGVPVYDADDRTKALYASSAELLAALKKILGDELVKDGMLDRQYMADRVFSDKSLLEKVEEVVFPMVLADFNDWKSHQDSRFVIMESAIILEKPFFARGYDKVLTVSSPLEIRIPRVVLRSGLKKEEVLQRMANQWDDAKREQNADYVIVSDGEHALLPQVLDIYDKMNN